MSLVLETLAEVAIVVAFLVTMRALAGRGPDPDPADFGPLGPGE